MMDNYIYITTLIVIVLLVRYISYKDRYLRQLMSIAAKIKSSNFNVRLEKPEKGKYSLIGDVMVELAGMLQRERLKNSENISKIEAVLSTVPNGLIALDTEENVIFINERARRICEVSGSPEGRKIFLFIKNSDIFAIIKSLIYNYREPVRYSDSKHHYEFHVENIMDSKKDTIIGKLINIDDLTAIIDTENLRRDFVSNVTHELKTPLTSISGFVETLRSNEDIPVEMQRKFLDIIEAETRRLNELIDDVLTLSFIEQNRDTERERINLVKLIEDIMFNLENIAKLKDIKLELVSDSRNIFINSSKYSLTMIFINIIDNSIKYSHEGQTVQIALESGDDNVTVSVTDRGRGISEEDIPRVFERFYRADKSRTRKEKGTGLGLAIVKHLTKSVGGEIDLQSRLGEGTTFKVILPVTCDKGE